PVTSQPFQEWFPIPCTCHRVANSAIAVHLQPKSVVRLSQLYVRSVQTILYGVFMSSAEALLSLRKVSKYFSLKEGWFDKPQSCKAVEEVSFDIHRGETFGLAGESGCGKSTLGRLALKLIPATSGQII